MKTKLYQKILIMTQLKAFQMKVGKNLKEFAHKLLAKREGLMELDPLIYQFY